MAVFLLDQPNGIIHYSLTDKYLILKIHQVLSLECQTRNEAVMFEMGE